MSIKSNITLVTESVTFIGIEYHSQVAATASRQLPATAGKLHTPAASLRGRSVVQHLGIWIGDRLGYGQNRGRDSHNGSPEH